MCDEKIDKALIKKRFTRRINRIVKKQESLPEHLTKYGKWHDGYLYGKLAEIREQLKMLVKDPDLRSACSFIGSRLCWYINKVGTYSLNDDELNDEQMAERGFYEGCLNQCEYLQDMIDPNNKYHDMDESPESVRILNLEVKTNE